MLLADADHAAGTGEQVGHAVDVGVDVATTGERAQVLAQDVAGDAEHVSSEGSGIADPFASLDHAQEGGLSQILGTFANFVLEEARDGVGVTIEQLLASSTVAASPGLEQFDV